MMRNPSWQRDELILALNLYFQEEYNKLSAKHPDIIQLSKLLNRLPFFSAKQRTETFRNPQGVYMKLANFVSIDPAEPRKGLPGYGQLDETVFFEFNERRAELQVLAEIIVQSLSDQTMFSQLTQFDSAEDPGESVAKEGKVIYRLHKLRERNAGLINKKKAVVLKKTGRLECEVCGIDFAIRYGQLGVGFIECHHTKPVSQMEPDSDTNINDLALVCANCHRMLHRDLSLSIADLKIVIQRKSTEYKF